MNSNTMIDNTILAGVLGQANEAIGGSREETDKLRAATPSVGGQVPGAEPSDIVSDAIRRWLGRNDETAIRVINALLNATPQQAKTVDDGATTDPVLKKAKEVLTPSPTDSRQIFEAYRAILFEMFGAGLTESNEALVEFIRWMNGVVQGYYEKLADEEEDEECEGDCKDECPKRCLLMQVVPYSAEDRGVESDLLAKAGFDMCHPDMDAMWERGYDGPPGQNPFPHPLHITDDEDGVYWPLAGIDLWNQKRVEAIVARAQESLAAVVHELEVASRGRVAVLQHFIPEGIKEC